MKGDEPDRVVVSHSQLVHVFVLHLHQVGVPYQLAALVSPKDCKVLLGILQHNAKLQQLVRSQNGPKAHDFGLDPQSQPGQLHQRSPVLQRMLDSLIVVPAVRQLVGLVLKMVVVFLIVELVLVELKVLATNHFGQGLGEELLNFGRQGARKPCYREPSVLESEFGFGGGVELGVLLFEAAELLVVLKEGVLEEGVVAAYLDVLGDVGQQPAELLEPGHLGLLLEVGQHLPARERHLGAQLRHCQHEPLELPCVLGQALVTLHLAQLVAGQALKPALGDLQELLQHRGRQHFPLVRAQQLVLPFYEHLVLDVAHLYQLVAQRKVAVVLLHSQALPLQQLVLAHHLQQVAQHRFVVPQEGGVQQQAAS